MVCGILVNGERKNDYKLPRQKTNLILSPMSGEFYIGEKMKIYKHQLMGMLRKASMVQDQTIRGKRTYVWEENIEHLLDLINKQIEGKGVEIESYLKGIDRGMEANYHFEIQRNKESISQIKSTLASQQERIDRLEKNYDEGFESYNDLLHEQEIAFSCFRQQESEINAIKEENKTLIEDIEDSRKILGAADTECCSESAEQIMMELTWLKKEMAFLNSEINIGNDIRDKQEGMIDKLLTENTALKEQVGVLMEGLNGAINVFHDIYEEYAGMDGTIVKECDKVNYALDQILTMARWAKEAENDAREVIEKAKSIRRTDEATQ